MLEVNSWLSAKLNIAKSSLSVQVQQAVLQLNAWLKKALMFWSWNVAPSLKSSAVW